MLAVVINGGRDDDDDDDEGEYDDDDDDDSDVKDCRDDGGGGGYGNSSFAFASAVRLRQQALGEVGVAILGCGNSSFVFVSAQCACERARARFLKNLLISTTINYTTTSTTTTVIHPRTHTHTHARTHKQMHIRISPCDSRGRFASKTTWKIPLESRDLFLNENTFDQKSSKFRMFFATEQTPRSGAGRPTHIKQLEPRMQEKPNVSES